MKHKNTALKFGPVKTPRNRTPKWELEARTRPAPDFTNVHHADKTDAYNHYETHGYFPDQYYKTPSAPKKCSTWNTAAEIAALVAICITIGALLGNAF